MDLYAILEENDIDLISYHIPVQGVKGLQFDKSIVIDKGVITEAEKNCILAEEIGHYLTSSGNILDQKNLSNLKQEKKAREWAYHNRISLDSLYKAFIKGAHNLFELASLLDVTEDFLHEAIMHFKSKYGMYFESDEYIVYFEPFGVLKKF